MFREEVEVWRDVLSGLFDRFRFLGTGSQVREGNLEFFVVVKLTGHLVNLNYYC